MKDEDKDLFESGENVDDLFESGEDVTTLFESGEDVSTPLSTPKDQTKKIEESTIMSSIPAPITGSIIGGAAGKLSQMGIDKTLDMSPKSISNIPGGRLMEEDIEFIRNNPVTYNDVSKETRSGVVDSVAKAAEEIKEDSFRLPKEAKQIMDRDQIKIASSEIKSDLANTLFNNEKRYGSELKPSKIKSVVERDEFGDIVEKTVRDAAKSPKGNIPKQLIAYNPKLADIYISDKGLLNAINTLVEELDNIEGDSGARAYERVQNIRDAIQMGEPGGSDKTKALKDLSEKLRSRVAKLSPEADKKLLQASGKMQDYEILKAEAKLAEKTPTPDVDLDINKTKLDDIKNIDEEILFKAINDPEYAKTVIAKDATERMLSNMGKQGLEFRRTLDNITSVLERNGYSEIANQFKAQAIKEVVKSKKIPTSAWIERALLGGSFAAIGAPAIGAGLATISTAADLFGTKAQEVLAKKSFKPVTKELPKVGALFGGLAGAVAGKAADIVDEPTPEGIALESALTLGMGMPASSLVAPMALKNEAIGPKKTLSPEMRSLEGSKFEEEVTNPEEALESGRTLSEYQKLKLQKMQEDTKGKLSNPVQEFKQEENQPTEIPQVIKPEVSSKESLFKNIVKAKEQKLKDFKLKNTLTNLENDDLESISASLASNPNASAQEYVAQLNDIKNLQGRERTSKLFSLMQQPGFRSLIKQRKGTDNVV